MNLSCRDGKEIWMKTPVEFILEFAEWCKTHSMSKEVSKFEIPEDLIIKK